MTTKHRPTIHGPAVKAARERLGLTQTELADLAGLARPTISRIETGDRGGNFETLLKLSRAIGIGIEDLIHEPNQRKRRAA